MPRSYPLRPVDLRAHLDAAGRAKAMDWMLARKAWTAGALCRYLIDEDAVQTRRCLLIEAFRAVDGLHRELIAEGQLRQIPTETALMYGWADA
jgi:hypothetical protein